MRITLSSFVLTPVMLAAAVLTAHASTTQTTLKVPFDFTVAGKTCPAGSYTVQSDTWGNSVKLEGVSGSFTWLIHPGDPAPTDKRIILKFDEIGSRHLLRSVQYRDQITSRLDKHSRDLESASIRVVQGQ
ncbi:MAG TPA: hypothetical protein VHX20_03150 [Terracidiphilus sp.]|jgi:hypothetical protein|nr:hypothetical protein [Terracidiphilus sp.]